MYLLHYITLTFYVEWESATLKKVTNKFVTFFVTNSNVSNIMSKFNKYSLNIIKL